MSWDYAAVEALLDEAIGTSGPEDPKGRKRKAILGAAAELFAKQGYRKTSVDEIATAAGVAKGTVYLYFKTKGVLIYSAIALEKKQHLEQLRPAFDPSVPARERLHRLLRGGLVMVTNMPVTSRLLADPREFAAVMHDIPKDVLEQGQAAGLELYGELVQEAASEKLSPTTLRERLQVLNVIGPLARQVTDPLTRGDLSPLRFARVLTDILVAGLLHPDSGES